MIISFQVENDLYSTGDNEVNLDLGIVLLSEVLCNIENDIIPVNTDEGANFHNLIGQVIGDRLTNHSCGDSWLVSSHSSIDNFYVLFEQQNRNNKVIISIPNDYYQKVIERNMQLTIANNLVKHWDDFEEGKTVLTDDSEKIIYVELNKAQKLA